MGAVNTTYTFTPTDTITSTKMNNIIDETVMTSQACLAGGGLEVASGQLTISQNAITPSRLAANAVTTDAIANSAVTFAKLSPFGPEWSNSLNNFNIKQNSLELSTGITTNSSSFIDFHSVYPLTDYECRIVRDTGPNGWFVIQNTGAGAISLQSAGGVYLASANMPNPAGNAPIYGVRAWGVIGLSPTRTLDAAANIASATKIDTTHTQVTFVGGIVDGSYVVSGCVKNDAALEFSTYDHQTTGFKIRHSTEGAGRFVQFMVIR